MELKINFKRPFESKVFAGGGQKGQILEACFEGRFTLVVIATQGGSEVRIVFTRLERGLIRSQFKVALVIRQTYYYRPDGEVER